MQITKENIDRADFLAGTLILVDKPCGWTSFDVVNKVRARLRQVIGVRKIKVGHAGTLDPMATGLLILCTGKWTKRLGQLQGLAKTYTGIIRLGEETPTYDRESEVSRSAPYQHLTEDDVHRAARQLTGDLMQAPPAFSAVKIQGERSYKLARKGKEVKLEPRPVTVYQFDVQQVALPDVEFVIECSTGTYIRSLAYDMGQELGCGAHLYRLRRTSVGEFSVNEAWQLNDLVGEISAGEAQP